MILTPKQQDAYFASQRNVAQPLSPQEWLEQQTSMATDEEINQLGEGGTVIRNGQKFRINPAGELIPEQEQVQREATGFPTDPDQIENYIIDNIISPIVDSGNTVNPNITPQQLEDLDPAIFLREAEASIAPEYKQKFGLAKEDLVRGLQEIGVDLSEELSGITRQAKQTRLQGREAFAGRGLAFSGQRETFETNISGAEQRATEQSRKLAFREAGQLGRTGERLIGSERVRGLEIPQIGGEQAFTPKGGLIGSLEREKQFTVESLAKESETQERQERAFATRSLSFA